MPMGAYYKGTLLWEVLQDFQPPAQRTGAGGHTGVTAQYAKTNPQSANMDRDIVIRTVVEPVDATATTNGLTPASHVLIALARCEERLIADIGEDGWLSWCEDVDRKADVTNGPYAAGAQVITYNNKAADWTPAVNKYVLVADKPNGLGFVAIITAVNAGVSVTLTVPADTSVTNTWTLVDVQFALDDVTYERMVYGGRELDNSVYKDGEWRPSVEYNFKGKAGPTYAAADAVPVDET